jgi:hypothetical protein
MIKPSPKFRNEKSPGNDKNSPFPVQFFVIYDKQAGHFFKMRGGVRPLKLPFLKTAALSV